MAAGARRKESFGGRTPQVVDDDVEAGVPTFASEGLGEIPAGLGEADDHVSSKLVKSIQYLFVPSGGDHPSSAEELGRLYGELAGDSGRTENQDSLTRSKLRPPSKRAPGRQAGVDDGCGDVVVNIVWDRKTVRWRHGSALCHAAVKGPRSGEEHSRTVVQASNSVHASHDRQFADRSVMRTAGHLLVDRFERSSANVHDHLVLFRNGLRKLLEVRWVINGM